MITPRHHPSDQRGAAMLWALAVLALLLVLALAGAPFMVKWYLQSWLQDRGVVNVSIADVDLNPFVGRFAIEAIAYEEDGEQRRADHLGLNLQWADLRRRRIRLADVRLTGARLAIRRTESEGIFLGSIALGAAEAAQSAEQTQQESGWGFGIDRVVLDDVFVDYQDPLVTQRVLFEELIVEDFATWAPDQVTRLRAVLSAEEQRLEVDGELAPLAAPWTVDLQTRGQQLQIDDIGPFLIRGDDVSSSGVLETDLRVSIEAIDGLGRLQASVSGSIGLQDPRLDVDGSETGAGDISWDGTVEYALTGEETNLAVDGTLRLEGVAAASTEPVADVTADALSWQGRVDYATAPGSRRLSASGKLETGEVGVSMPPVDDAPGAGAGASLAFGALRLEADTSRAVFDANGMDLAWDGSLGLEALETVRGPQHATLDMLSWRGQSGLVVAGDSPQLRIDGDLQADGLVSTDSATPLQTNLERLAWSGSAEVDLNAGGRTDVTGEIGSGALTVQRVSDGPALLRLGELKGMFEPAPEPGAARLRSLHFADLALLQRPSADGSDRYVARIPTVEVDGLAVGAERAEVGEITLTDARLWLERAEDGSMLFGPGVAAGEEQAPDEDPPTAQQSDPPATFGFSLAGLATAGETRLDFADRSVRPSVNLSLSPLTMRLGQIDSARTQAATDLKLDTRIGQFTTLTFEGVVKPLAPAFALEGQGAIRSLDLVELDGYARRNTSHRIDGGTLRADIDVNLADGRLDSLAELKIFNLEMLPLKAGEKDEYSEELGVPLTVALDLLRDKEDNITLEVPLEGEIDNLQAGIGDALRIVLNKGIQAGIRTAATTYFAPLWPALAASKLFGAATALRFRPVEFTPAEDTLSAAAIDYVDQMGAILVDRPKLSMTVCGRAVSADLALLYPGVDAAAIGEDQDAALADLARRRHLVIKGRLVEAGVEPSRVATCAARATPSGSGPPRADFGV